MTGLDPERIVLGCILDGRGGDIAELGLTAGDFDHPKHGNVWSIIERVGCAPYGVQQALAQTPWRDEHTLTLDLIREASTVVDVAYYADEIRRRAALRRLTQVGQRILQATEDTTADPSLIVDRAREHLDAVQTGSTVQTVDMAQAVREAIEELEQPLRGTTWPWDINDVLMPIEPGRLYIVAARPGRGKSLFGQGLATSFAHQGLPVAFSSLEMRRNELIHRILAAARDIELGHMSRRDLTEGDWQQVAAASKRVSDLPIAIDDIPLRTVQHIRQHARATKGRHGSLGLVVVDYLQLVEVDGQMADRPRHEQVGDITRRLKIMARELDVPVVALAQLNRGPESRKDGRPIVADLRESGQTEQDADAILLLHSDPQVPVELEVIVGKQRNGPMGVSRTLQLVGHYGRIE